MSCGVSSRYSIKNRHPTKFSDKIQIQGLSIAQMAYQHSLIFTFLWLGPLALLLLSIAIRSSDSAAEQCQLPAGVHPILLPFEDEETALMEATCHVACAKRLLNEVLIFTSR